MDKTIPTSVWASGLRGPCVPGTSSAVGKQKMAEETGPLIQPNYGNMFEDVRIQIQTVRPLG